MAVAFIALGSNLGRRRGNLKNAIKEIEYACKILASSSIYESEPMYVLNQPKFLNMVVKIETGLAPPELLEFLQGIEKKLGRERNKEIRNGPRLIDLDILFYETGDWTQLLQKATMRPLDGPPFNREPETQDSRLKTSDPILPHPRMLERPFVLIPLYEIEKKDWVLKAIKSLEATLNPYIPPKRIGPAIP